NPANSTIRRAKIEATYRSPSPWTQPILSIWKRFHLDRNNKAPVIDAIPNTAKKQARQSPGTRST
ncbi:MAG: hypothetical protein MK103_04950, partial [Planctomycetes bacterium]|nr:hypothetical protein [Planctomycetota bacterium]